MNQKSLKKDVTLDQLQEYVREMVVARGFSTQSIHEQFMKLLEECGELAKATKHHLKRPADQALHKEVSHEAADVLIYILDIANRLDINLAQALREKEKINEGRKW